MRREISPTVYMLASHKNGTLYLGVTSNFIQRLHQHRSGLIEGFTKDYGVQRLVWFESGGSIEEAIQREKQIKKWNRQWKVNLIERGNPDWDDLAVELGFERLESRRVD
ncbi:MAG TPA: GIY-YIG nuclease family protein [Sphingobium sp.]